MSPPNGGQASGSISPLPAFEITLTDEQLLTMGRIVVVQGQLEHLLRKIFEELRKFDETTAPLKDKETLGGMVPLLAKQQLGSVEPDTAAKIRTLCEKLQTIPDRRNALLHAIYGHQYEGMGKGLMLQSRSMDGGGSGMFYFGECPPNVGLEIFPAAYRNDGKYTRNGVDDLGPLQAELIACSQGAGFILSQLQNMQDFTVWRTWPFA